MFLFLPQEFQVKAYNKFREVLTTDTCDELVLSNKYNETNTGMDYVYVDIFVSDGLAAIERIVIKPGGSQSEVVQIDDFTIGLYRGLPERTSG